MPRTRGAWAFWLTGWAIVWSVLVLASGYVVVLAWEGWHTTSDGLVIYRSVRFLGANGWWVMVPLALPIALTLVAAASLRRRWSDGGRASTGVAWCAVGVLCAIAILDAFDAASFGVLLIPVAVPLAIATALTPRARPSPGLEPKPRQP
jgi:hypothetical protein